MPRAPRSIVPDIPHHLTQRGNRRPQVFFDDDDRRIYLAWLREYADKAGVDVLALPEMAGPFEAAVDMLCVARVERPQQPLEGVRLPRYGDEMDVVRHQAIGEDRSGEQPTTARSAERMSGPALTNEEVKEARTVLRDLGLYDGEVDGIYGRKTMAAVGKFQEQNDLPRTNSLNAQTREKLQQQASSAGAATGGTTGGTTGGDTGGGKRVSPQAPSGQGTPGGQPGVQPEAPPSPQQPQRSQ